MNYEEIIAQISIRGRIALGTNCIETFLSTHSLMSKRLQELLSHLWSFTSSEHLDLWEEELKYLLPDCDDYNLYSTFYGFEGISKKHKVDITNMIQGVIEIGVNNLYGKFNSKFTSEPLINIISVLNKNHIEITNINEYLKYSVKEDGGWGRAFDSNEIMKLKT